MILGLFWLGVANVSAALGAHALLRRLRTGEPSVDLVIFLTARLFLISSTVLIAGVGGFVSGPALGWTATIILAALLAAGEFRRVPRPPAWQMPIALKLAAALLLLRLVLQVWLFSPHLGDALAYHLPKIGEWVRAEGFTREMGLHPHVTFPAGFELVETWWVVFLRHDLLIEMAGVEFLLVAYAAILALGRRWGLSDLERHLAALLFVLTPGLHFGGTSCLNDTPVASLAVATFALVAYRAPTAIVLLAVGLGTGVKATYVYTLPGIVLLAYLCRKSLPLRASSPRIAALVAVGALVVGGFWYGRNLLWYGNPFYPVGTPGYADDPIAVQAGPRLTSLWGNFSDLVESRFYDRAAAYGANVDYSAGWGPVVFACGPLALAASWGASPEVRRLGIAFLLSLGSCLLLAVHDPWALKYVFFFPAVLCLAVARLCTTQKLLARLVWAGLAYGLATTCLPYDLQSRHLGILAGQSWRERTALAFTRGPIAEPRVACLGGFRANAYLLYGPDFSRMVVYLRPRDSDELVAEMRRQQVRLLYAVPASAHQQDLLDECLRDGRLRSEGGAMYALP